MGQHQCGDRTGMGRNALRERVAGAFLLLAFGLGTLAYLIAIERPEWFVLRPASGTAAAMSLAGNVTPDDTHRQR